MRTFVLIVKAKVGHARSTVKTNAACSGRGFADPSASTLNQCCNRVPAWQSTALIVEKFPTLPSSATVGRAGHTQAGYDAPLPPQTMGAPASAQTRRGQLGGAHESGPSQWQPGGGAADSTVHMTSSGGPASTHARKVHWTLPFGPQEHVLQRSGVGQLAPAAQKVPSESRREHGERKRKRREYARGHQEISFADAPVCASRAPESSARAEDV